MRRPEPCDICGAGLVRADGAVGTLRCAECHDGQLKQVAVECAKRGWRPSRISQRGREVVRVMSPLGAVHLVDMDDLAFLLVDVDRELADAA